jgi:hypothetical protein
MQNNVEEVPDGMYKIEVVAGTKQLAGYCWVIENNSDYYQYFVMREQYLPPITGVSSTIFGYSPAGFPSSFESLAKFQTTATEAIHAVYPGAAVGHSATLETDTPWELPS